MKSVNMLEAKTNLSKLIVFVEKNNASVIICRNGEPVAKISPIENKPNPLEIHSQLANSIEINYDPTEPLTDDEWPSEYL